MAKKKKEKTKANWNWQEAYLSPEQLLRVEKYERRPDKIMVNDLYEVWITEMESTSDTMPNLLHLSIKKRTKGVVHDWRHLQRIKNELVGPEYEGVELYPAESRLVDTANQYHLWVMKDPTFRWPFGYKERLVISESTDGAKQRPIYNGH